MVSSLPRCCLTVLGAALLCGAGTLSVSAEDWMYRRSYYSHALPPGVKPDYPLPESRAAYRAACYNELPGLQFRSAYRVNNYVINNGPRSDRTIYREGYVEFGP